MSDGVYLLAHVYSSGTDKKGFTIDVKTEARSKGGDFMLIVKCCLESLAKSYVAHTHRHLQPSCATVINYDS